MKYLKMKLISIEVVHTDSLDNYKKVNIKDRVILSCISIDTG